MQREVLDNITIFLSQQVIDDYKKIDPEIIQDLKDMGMTDDEILQDRIETAIRSMFHERLDIGVLSLLESYQESRGGMAILNAHGHRDPHTNEWFFADGDQEIPVQTWVNEMDGKFGVLVLLVCDDHAVEVYPPTTHTSIIAVGDGIVRSGYLFGFDLHNFQVIHPTYGEIDGYTIDDARSVLL